MKVAVIGTGPSSLASALALIGKGLIVDIIDPWIEPDSLPRGTRKYLGFDLKTRFNSDHMYTSSEEINLKLSSRPVSNVIGGLTSVWGAGLSRNLNSLRENFSEMEITQANDVLKVYVPFSEDDHPISKRLEELIIRFKSKKFEIKPSLLAYKAKLCQLTGGCMSGCINEAIWSAGDVWRGLVADQKINIIEGSVESLDGSTVKVRQNETINQYNYGHIFLGAGAISSSSILQKSGLLPSEVYLSETTINYTPIFTIRKPSEVHFNLAQAYITSKEGDFWMSVFESTNFVAKKIRTTTKIPLRLPKFISNRILIGISYEESKFSHKIRVSFENNTSTVTGINATKKPFKFNKMKLTFSLSRFGWIIPFNIVKKGPPGSSYHLGVVSNAAGDLLLDKLGRPGRSAGVSVIDSSSLVTLPTGPITYLSMVNAFLITNKIIELK